MKFNNKEFSIPKKTMELVALQKEVQVNTNDPITMYERMFDFIITAFGEDQMIELLKTSDINEMDLIDLQLLYSLIVFEWERPAFNQSKKMMREAMAGQEIKDAKEMLQLK